MKRYIQTAGIVFIGLTLSAGCKSDLNTEQVTETQHVKEMVTRRVGMIIKIREDKIEEYRKLDAPENPGVRDQLTNYSMRSFSIFHHQMDDGNYYEFGYYEYTGENFEVDMANLDKNHEILNG
jgi:L-rhamnose mutarotase